MGTGPLSHPWFEELNNSDMKKEEPVLITHLNKPQKEAGTKPISEMKKPVKFYDK